MTQRLFPLSILLQNCVQKYLIDHWLKWGRQDMDLGLTLSCITFTNVLQSRCLISEKKSKSVSRYDINKHDNAQ